MYLMMSEVKRLEAQSLLGDKMKDVSSTGIWDILEDEIFKPLEEEAFAIFKSVEVTNVSAVAQAQMLGSAVDKIRSRFKAIITEGDLARQQIKQIGEEENG